MNTAATWIEVVGIGLFFVALVALAVMSRNSVRIYPLRTMPPQPVMARLEAVPEPASKLLSAPMPHSCAVEVFREYYWHDPEFGLRVTREIARVAKGVLSPSEASEVIREITAARHVIRGEIAS
jgi:hypothetical protein